MTIYPTNIRRVFHRFSPVLLLLTAVLTVHAADEEITPEELISRHLESIGTPEARQQIATRRYIGDGTWRMLVGGVGQVVGQVSFVSSSNTSDFSFGGGGGQAFSGEQFSFDGKDAFVKRAFQEQY
ncbi:MAG: hypothetical protein O2795_15550 [Acidobacteria bacterium]|nr:hypothetical protein [Acidobacteriota bacterium]